MEKLLVVTVGRQQKSKLFSTGSILCTQAQAKETIEVSSCRVDRFLTRRRNHQRQCLPCRLIKAQLILKKKVYWEGYQLYNCQQRLSYFLPLCSSITGLYQLASDLCLRLPRDLFARRPMSVSRHQYSYRESCLCIPSPYIGQLFERIWVHTVTATRFPCLPALQLGLPVSPSLCVQ